MMCLSLSNDFQRISRVPSFKMFKMFFFHFSGILRFSGSGTRRFSVSVKGRFTRDPAKPHGVTGTAWRKSETWREAAQAQKNPTSQQNTLNTLNTLLPNLLHIVIYIYISIRVNNHVWTQHTRLLAADMLTAMSWATDWEGDFLPRKKAVASAPRSDRVRGWPSDGCAWIAEICANWYWNNLKWLEMYWTYFHVFWTLLYDSCMLLFTTLSTNAGGILQQRSWSHSGAVVEAFRPIFNNLRSPKPQWMARSRSRQFDKISHLFKSLAFSSTSMLRVLPAVLQLFPPNAFTRLILLVSKWFKMF